MASKLLVSPLKCPACIGRSAAGMTKEELRQKLQELEEIYRAVRAPWSAMSYRLFAVVVTLISWIITLGVFFYLFVVWNKDWISVLIAVIVMGTFWKILYSCLRYKIRNLRIELDKKE